MIATYTFFGLDELAKEIQELFKDRPMCLALSSMFWIIDIDALEILGKETPAFLKPKNNFLMLISFNYIYIFVQKLKVMEECATSRTHRYVIKVKELL